MYLLFYIRVYIHVNDWDNSSTCGCEYASNDATQSDKKLPEGHVLLCDFDHQWIDIIFHEDPWDSVAACSMVYPSLLQGHRHKRIKRTDWLIRHITHK